MSDFIFELSRNERQFLKRLAVLSIRSRFEKGIEFPEPPNHKMTEKLGAFVTLKKDGRLRGCIGQIDTDRPLWETIINMAAQAAFKDSRFLPLKREELDEVDIEISVLSPLMPLDDPARVVPGRHGLLVENQGSRGLLLPQVATEWGWDRETFLSHTCLKAGLPGSCWKDPETKIFWFQAIVF